MIDLLSGPPAQMLAQTLLHFLWQALAIALLLKLCGPLLHNVHSRYAASLSALAMMLAMPIATCYLLSQRGAIKAPAILTDEPAIGFAPTESSIAQVMPTLSYWQPLLVSLYFAGVMLLAARLLLGYLATLWLRGDRRPLPAALAAKVAWLGRRLGVTTRCRVFFSSRVTEAIAVGCFKPLVLIPLAWASELPPSALEAIIAHELAHIRRWDLWATLLQRRRKRCCFIIQQCGGCLSGSAWSASCAAMLWPFRRPDPRLIMSWLWKPSRGGRVLRR
jgi:D-alanyl-D-alanine endopeptidase (penicillin-binding protein 7)